MKTYVDDPFNLKLSIRGLVMQLAASYFDFYEYAYFFTFKRSLKEYGHEFRDPYDQLIEDDDFFNNSTDPMVRSCLSVQDKIIDVQEQFRVNWGIDHEEDMHSEIVQRESNRFQPYKLNYKRSKNYKKLKLAYEKTLVDSIANYYLFASAITASKYRIPLVLKRQFELPIPASLKLLNHDDHNVVILMELICGLKEDLDELRMQDQKNKRISKSKSQAPG